jgi:hypothetical protein
MAGTLCIGGCVSPLSQCQTVQAVTPSWTAASFAVSRRTSRRLRTCSPKVRGSKSLAFGFRALRRSGTGCKRATRPCPCGYRGVRNADCRCDDAAVAKYVGKLSGPLLDRIDMQVEIARVPSPQQSNPKNHRSLPQRVWPKTPSTSMFRRPRRSAGKAARREPQPRLSRRVAADNGINIAKLPIFAFAGLR